MILRSTQKLLLGEEFQDQNTILSVRRTFVIKGCCQSAYWRPLRNCYQLLRAGMPSPAPLGAWVIDVKSLSLNPKDSVMTNAQKIRAVLGGGTDCAAPMKNLNDRNEKADVCFLISDNQSWIGTYNQFYSYYDASDFNKVEPTKLMTEWKKFRTNNPGAKLVVLDIQPSTTTQAYETEDILNISGFGDHVFEIVSQFAEGRLDQGHWTKVIDDIQL